MIVRLAILVLMSLLSASAVEANSEKLSERSESLEVAVQESIRSEYVKIITGKNVPDQKPASRIYAGKVNAHYTITVKTNLIIFFRRIQV